MKLLQPPVGSMRQDNQVNQALQALVIASQISGTQELSELVLGYNSSMADLIGH